MPRRVSAPYTCAGVLLREIGNFGLYHVICTPSLLFKLVLHTHIQSLAALSLLLVPVPLPPPPSSPPPPSPPPPLPLPSSPLHTHSHVVFSESNSTIIQLTKEHVQYNKRAATYILVPFAIRNNDAMQCSIVQFMPQHTSNTPPSPHTHSHFTLRHPLT